MDQTTAPTGPTGPTEPTGQTGATALAVEALASPARTLDTSFQPSSTNQTFVTYSVTVVTSLKGGSGLGGVARIELRSDASNPPTTVRASGGGSLTSIPNTVPAGVTITTAVQVALTYVVPAGHFVKIASVGGQGSPTLTAFSLDVVTEIPVVLFVFGE